MLLVTACGGGGGKTAPPDATVPPADAEAIACTPETLASACPPRPCEVAAGCEGGECVYEPFVCGVPGRVCPVQRCVSSTEGGVVTNRCEVEQDAPCGDGGTCQGVECVYPEQGLSLSGGLQAARLDRTSGTLQLDGELGFGHPRQAPLQAGSWTLRGGIAP